MNKKVILIRGGDLKTRVVRRAFSLLLSEESFDFVELDSQDKEVHIISKDECLKSMREKILKVKKEYGDAAYFVFMRGRFDDYKTSMEEAALVLIQDSFGKEGISQAASFQVPEKIANLVREGVSFSKAVEQVSGATNVKEGSGFVGILTKGNVSKEEQYFQPTIIALSSCLSLSL